MTAALTGLALVMGLLQLLPRHPGSLAILSGAQALAAANIIPIFAVAPHFVADKEGYFAAEGISVTTQPVQTGAVGIPALISGAFDVLYSSTVPILIAMERGIDLRIVSDKSQNVVGRSSIKMLVRKPLVDSGRFKTFSDLKGLKVAEAAPGGSAFPVIIKFLEKGGLTYNDIDRVYMSFPQMSVALQSGAIDVALPAEPSVTQALRLGGEELPDIDAAGEVVAERPESFELTDAFVDAGGVMLNENPFTAGVNNRRNLAGGGLGLSWARTNDFQLKLTVATRIGSERVQSDSDDRTRGWLQAIKYF